MFCEMGLFCLTTVATRLDQHINALVEVWVRMPLFDVRRTARAWLHAEVDFARVTPRLDFDTADVVLIVHVAQLAAAALLHLVDDVSMALRPQSGAVFAPEPLEHLFFTFSALCEYLIHSSRIKTVVGILRSANG